MATIKSYTDISQSKKLAEILPHESADMYWYKFDKNKNTEWTAAVQYEPLYNGEIPCWSLAALYVVLPMLKEGKDTANPFIAKTPDNEYYVVYATSTKEVDNSGIYDNPVDACIEMIIRLKEQNLI